MKALIVDDQLHVFKAMQLQAAWEDYNITEVFYARNGLDALDIMKQEQPELVFTDMQMPHMDGPQFLKRLREENYNCEVIAISGYNDFSYVKSLITASGIDYLVKPIDGDELNQAIGKAVERIWQKKEAIQGKLEIEKNKVERNCQRIGLWLNGSAGFSGDIMKCLEFLGFGEKNFRVALFLLDNPNRIISDIYDDAVSSFHLDLLKIARDLFVKSTSCYLMPANRYMYFFLMQTPGADEEGYKERLDRMVHVIRNLMSAESIYEYSPRIENIEELPAIIERLKGRIQTRELVYKNGKTQPSGKNDKKGNVDYHEGRISGLSFLLKTAVKEKDLEAIGNIISEFCAGIRGKKHYSLYELQIYASEINLLLKKILADSHEIDFFQLKNVSLWIYDLDVWEQDVKSAFLEIASCHFEQVLNITAVHAYILENYNMADLSVSLLSERFNQSPQYLSKLYKNKYNETIGQTIKRLRMEKAMDYLRHGSMPVREIAVQTGYEDENYFGKVFKKYCGISPQQYRKEQNGQ